MRDILRQQNTTAVLVTHDQHEAFAIADQIGVLHQGVIQQWDSAYKLYHEPANLFVAGFIGEGVLIPGAVVGPAHARHRTGRVPAQLPACCAAGCPVDVLVRPDDVVHDDASPMQATVLAKAFRGADFLYTLQLASGHPGAVADSEPPRSSRSARRSASAWKSTTWSRSSGPAARRPPGARSDQLR